MKFSWMNKEIVIVIEILSTDCISFSSQPGQAIFNIKYLLKWWVVPTACIVHIFPTPHCLGCRSRVVVLSDIDTLKTHNRTPFSCRMACICNNCLETSQWEGSGLHILPKRPRFHFRNIVLSFSLRQLAHHCPTTWWAWWTMVKEWRQNQQQFHRTNRTPKGW